MKRYKCPRCGSIRVVLLEYTEEDGEGFGEDEGDCWRADIRCGKCGYIIYELGV